MRPTARLIHLVGLVPFLGGRARLRRQTWLRVMVLAAIVIVVNAPPVVLPAVRSAPGMAPVNVSLTLLAMASGVWRLGVGTADHPLQ